MRVVLFENEPHPRLPLQIRNRSAKSHVTRGAAGMLVTLRLGRIVSGLRIRRQLWREEAVLAADPMFDPEYIDSVIWRI